MECVRYAQDQNRYILTRGTAFRKLSGYVPAGSFCEKHLKGALTSWLFSRILFKRAQRRLRGAAKASLGVLQSTRDER